jgi:hypothetical protein
VDRLHAWMFDTPDENKAEIDQVVAAGAFVMGRNMFGPSRSEWDLSWKGRGALLATHISYHVLH